MAAGMLTTLPVSGLHIHDNLSSINWTQQVIFLKRDLKVGGVAVNLGGVRNGVLEGVLIKVYC